MTVLGTAAGGGEEGGEKEAVKGRRFFFLFTFVGEDAPPVVVVLEGREGSFLFVAAAAADAGSDDLCCFFCCCRRADFAWEASCVLMHDVMCEARAAGVTNPKFIAHIGPAERPEDEAARAPVVSERDNVNNDGLAVAEKFLRTCLSSFHVGSSYPLRHSAVPFRRPPSERRSAYLRGRARSNQEGGEG